jgi:hypothetical protein
MNRGKKDLENVLPKFFQPIFYYLLIIFVTAFEHSLYICPDKIRSEGQEQNKLNHSPLTSKDYRPSNPCHIFLFSAECGLNPTVSKTGRYLSFLHHETRSLSSDVTRQSRRASDPNRAEYDVPFDWSERNVGEGPLGSYQLVPSSGSVRNLAIVDTFSLFTASASGCEEDDNGNFFISAFSFPPSQTVRKMSRKTSPTIAFTSPLRTEKNIDHITLNCPALFKKGYFGGGSRLPLPFSILFVLLCGSLASFLFHNVRRVESESHNRGRI